MERKTILVLFGGCSGEHEVSLVSAHAVLRNMDPLRYDAVAVGITREGRWLRYTGDLERLLELLRDVKREDTVVISGWAQNVTFYVSIFRQLAGTGCMTVLDCSGEALWQCLGCHPFLIKPNLTELGALFGVEDLEYAESVELAHQLQLEGARNVMVSMGSEGAFLLTESRELYVAAACPGQTVSTVGAGDSLVAGFLTGLRQTGDFGKALQMGVAAGCATAFSGWLGTKELTMELLGQINVEKRLL